MAAVSVRSGLQAWPRPKAEAASQNVEDGRRTWLRVPDGLLVRARRKLLLSYWDFQHIANISRGFTEDRAGHRKHPVSGTRVGGKCCVDFRGQRSDEADRLHTVEKQSWRNSTSERTCDISDLVAACTCSVRIFRMHAIRIFHISRIIAPPIRFFPNQVASERKECERHTVKQREEQQAKQQRLLLAALMCYTHASRLNKDGPFDISITASLAGGCDKTISTSDAGTPAKAALIRAEDKK